MIQVNLLQPKSPWLSLERYKGSITIMVRQPGAAWPACCHIRLWNIGPGGPGSKSWYVVKKVKTVEYYKEN